MECLETKKYQKYTKPKYDIADIFRKHTQNLPKFSYEQLKVISAICFCRTKKLGGHALHCSDCGYTEISYNSCRDRHCPKCQTMKKIKWLQDRYDEILPIKYFHIVFTLPNLLNRLILQNKRELYDILFKSAKETLTEAALNPKNLGAKIGFISILHTWGQNLMEHPHLHCVVTGGGLSKNKKEWISSRDNFLISVKLLSKLYRGKYLDYLKKLYSSGKLSFFGDLKKYEEKVNFDQLLTECYQKDWVVYSKKPFSNPRAVFQYLGRYTHRVAISNHRIVNITESDVLFSYKDYKDNCKKKVMRLKAEEFLRRFLLHILPRGFKRIRFCGIFSNRYKRKNIDIILKLLEEQNETIQDNLGIVPVNIEYTKFTEITECPRCHSKNIEIIEIPVGNVNDIYINTS